MSEVAPVEISGTLGTLNQFNAVTGILVANSLSFLVPYPQNFEAGTLKIWRLLFAFPALIALLQLLLLIFVFKLDTPNYYKSLDDMDSHDKIISKIYAYKSSSDPLTDASQERSIEERGLLPNPQIINHSAIDTEKTLSDLVSPRFRMALFIGVCLSMFHQLTGVNGVIFHSNDLFTQGETGLSASKAAKIGTFLLGISGFVGTFLCLFIVKWVGRKTLLLSGVFMMMITLTYIGITIYFDWTVQTIIG